MSKLLTTIKYAVSKIYPPNTDLSATSTFYVCFFIIQGQRFINYQKGSIEIITTFW